MMGVRQACAAFALAGAAAWSTPARATDLLPDMIVDTARLQDYVLVKNVIPGRVHIRFTNATANIGQGPLFIYPGAATANTQPVFQRIFLSQGGFRDREAGVFVFHPTHNHFHFGAWAQYSIRAVLPGDGIGPVLREGGKTSFCLLDSSRYTGPGNVASATRQFVTCGSSTQGISVGWEDLYSRTLPDQWIDITGLAPGEYWLESIVDPKNQVEESDETNNVGRIKINLTADILPVPDEIPAGRGFPIALLVVLLFTGVGTLALRAGAWGIRQP